MSTAHVISAKKRTIDVFTETKTDFESLLLSPKILAGLKHTGFCHPSPIQLEAIPLAKCGVDLICQAKSGTGKTCVFAVCALEAVDVKSPVAQVLVLAPTREIAHQIHGVISSIGVKVEGLKCHLFIGGIPVEKDIQNIQACHIAIGTPGRIKFLIDQKHLLTQSIRLFVLDEADKLVEEGSFQEQINWIFSTLGAHKQVLALSATYPESLASFLDNYMQDPIHVRINPEDLTLKGIRQYYKTVAFHPLPHKAFQDKCEVLLGIIKKLPFQQCMVFSNYQSRAEQLSKKLTKEGWPCTYIAGSQIQTVRLHAMNQLKNYNCRVLITTDLTSRGIDCDKVNLVINLDLPWDTDTYLHRIGRAGRFGSYGVAISIVTEGDEYKKILTISDNIGNKISRLPENLQSLNDIANEQQQMERSNLTASVNGTDQEYRTDATRLQDLNDAGNCDVSDRIEANNLSNRSEDAGFNIQVPLIYGCASNDGQLLNLPRDLTDVKRSVADIDADVDNKVDVKLQELDVDVTHPAKNVEQNITDAMFYETSVENVIQNLQDVNVDLVDIVGDIVDVNGDVIDVNGDLVDVEKKVINDVEGTEDGAYNTHRDIITFSLSTTSSQVNVSLESNGTQSCEGDKANNNAVLGKCCRSAEHVSNELRDNIENTQLELQNTFDSNDILQNNTDSSETDNKNSTTRSPEDTKPKKRAPPKYVSLFAKTKRCHKQETSDVASNRVDINNRQTHDTVTLTNDNPTESADTAVHDKIRNETASDRDIIDKRSLHKGKSSYGRKFNKMGVHLNMIDLTESFAGRSDDATTGSKNKCDVSQQHLMNSCRESRDTIYHSQQEYADDTSTFLRSRLHDDTDVNGSDIVEAENEGDSDNNSCFERLDMDEFLASSSSADESECTDDEESEEDSESRFLFPNITPTDNGFVDNADTIYGQFKRSSWNHEYFIQCYQRAYRNHVSILRQMNDMHL